MILSLTLLLDWLKWKRRYRAYTRTRLVKGRQAYKYLFIIVLYHVQFNSDFYVFGETVKDYVALLTSIRVCV
jgi:hypothetical protein